jgi:hypothetical protein
VTRRRNRVPAKMSSRHARDLKNQQGEVYSV